MLTVYIKGENEPGDITACRDMEAEFLKIKVTGSELDKVFIRNIEKGQYLDDTFFVDRFGGKLYLSCLSTECKSALVVAHNPNKLLDLEECGQNAIDSIISHCTEGNIIITYGDCCLGVETRDGGYTNDKIDVFFDGIRFTSANTWFNYMQNEWEDKIAEKVMKESPELFDD